MPPVVIDLRAAEDPRDVVHRAVQAVAEGKLVVFPTETVYGLAALALNPEAVARLIEAKGRGQEHPLTLAVKSAADARDYAPDMSPLADRLARRCWPGPVTLVLDDSHPESLIHQIPASVLKVVSPADTVGLRVPGHPLLLDVMRMVVGPLVLTSANPSGQADSTTAGQAVQTLGDRVDLVLDDGPARFGQPSSVVRVRGDQFEILREGVVPKRTVQRLSSLLILFVCTGNTCRSPMAEWICRKMLADRLGCGLDELEDRGILVMSAGVAAMGGARATPEALEVLAKRGVNMADHETQPLTEPLSRYADRIFTMTRSHREAIVAQWPEVARRTELLSVSGEDVSDPIGGPLSRYEGCAEQIEMELAARLDELSPAEDNGGS